MITVTADCSDSLLSVLILVVSDLLHVGTNLVKTGIERVLHSKFIKITSILFQLGITIIKEHIARLPFAECFSH